MAAILAVGNLKGGTAKTTTAMYLATCFEKLGYEKKVAVVDADIHASAFNWAQNGELSFPVYKAELEGSGLKKQLSRLGSEYEIIIVDAGDNESTVQKVALQADTMLIPLAPTEQDANRLLHTLELVETVAEARGKEDLVRILIVKYKNNTILGREFRNKFREYPLMQARIRELERYKQGFGEQPTYLEEYRRVARELLKDGGR